MCSGRGNPCLRAPGSAHLTGQGGQLSQGRGHPPPGSGLQPRASLWRPACLNWRLRVQNTVLDSHYDHTRGDQAEGRVVGARASSHSLRQSRAHPSLLTLVRLRQALGSRKSSSPPAALHTSLWSLSTSRVGAKTAELCPRGKGGQGTLQGSSMEPHLWAQWETLWHVWEWSICLESHYNLTETLHGDQECLELAHGPPSHDREHCAFCTLLPVIPRPSGAAYPTRCTSLALLHRH